MTINPKDGEFIFTYIDTDGQIVSETVSKTPAHFLNSIGPDKETAEIMRATTEALNRIRRSRKSTKLNNSPLLDNNQ